MNVQDKFWVQQNLVLVITLKVVQEWNKSHIGQLSHAHIFKQYPYFFAFPISSALPIRNLWNRKGIFKFEKLKSEKIENRHSDKNKFLTELKNCVPDGELNGTVAWTCEIFVRKISGYLLSFCPKDKMPQNRRYFLGGTDPPNSNCGFVREVRLGQVGVELKHR